MMMTDEAWKICKMNSDSKLGVPKIHGQHSLHRKSMWIEECKDENILGYWDWVAKKVSLTKLKLVN